MTTDKEAVQRHHDKRTEGGYYKIGRYAPVKYKDIINKCINKYVKRFKKEEAE